MSKYEIKTKRGYDFYEVSSAFQKSIRRGLEEDAIFWAVELFESGFGEYVMKRIRIISSEDIGLAEPSISSEVWALYEMYREQAKKKDDKNHPERLFLIHSVMLLSRSRKSRLIDWTLIWAWFTHAFRRLPIPDFAFDKHNEKGRKMGRSWYHFFSEGTLLHPHSPLEKEEEMRERARRAISDPSGVSLFE